MSRTPKYMARDFGSWDDWLSTADGQGQIVSEIERMKFDDALSRDLALEEHGWSPALAPVHAPDASQSTRLATVVRPPRAKPQTPGFAAFLEK